LSLTSSPSQQQPLLNEGYCVEATHTVLSAVPFQHNSNMSVLSTLGL